MENKLKKNAIWNTVGITFNSFNSLFFLIIVNRVNGVKTAGVFSFAFSMSCLLYVVGIYAGRTYQVSDVREDINDKEYLLHKILTCMGMLIICIVFIAVRNYTSEKSIIIVIMCLYKCLEAFDDTLYGYLQKNEELHIVGKSLFLKSLMGLIVFCVVDIKTNNLLLACIMLTVNSIVFVMFYDIRKSIHLIKKDRPHWNKVGSLFKKGFPVFAFSFLAIYIVSIQKYIIDFVMDDVAQTIFGIIVMPGTIMSLCGQYITAPLLTKIVYCYDVKQYNEFKKIINRMILLLLGFGICAELAAYLLGIPVLSYIYAIELKQYKIDLLMIILGAILYAMAGVYSTALVTMRKNNVQLLIYLIDSFIGVVVSYFLVMSYGIHGAVAGYTITMIPHIVLYRGYFEKEYHKWKNEKER